MLGNTFICHPPIKVWRRVAKWKVESRSPLMYPNGINTFIKGGVGGTEMSSNRLCIDGPTTALVALACSLINVNAECYKSGTRNKSICFKPEYRALSESILWW